jgi:hypothetical protein
MPNSNFIPLEFRIELSYEFGQTGIDTLAEFGTVIASVSLTSTDTRVGEHVVPAVRVPFDERGYNYGEMERAQDKAVEVVSSRLATALGKLLEG